MAKVTNVYKESYPALRFIGKRYTDADRGADHGYGHKWREWDANGSFEPLEKLESAAAHENARIAYMRFTHEFEYWIGMFFPENTPVPEGYAHVDIPAGEAGICWIYGSDDTGEIYGPEAHEMCAKKLLEAGWELADHIQAFERYNKPRFTTPDEHGNVILDYGIYLKG